jgi:hypothetical protein
VKVTGISITDEQIQELWGDYAITIQEATLALSDGARRSRYETSEMFAARIVERVRLRARCAEIFNARGAS